MSRPDYSITKKALEPIWNLPVDEISRRLNVPTQSVYYWGKKHGLPSKKRASALEDRDPTEDEVKEIEARMAEVRSRWTPEEAAQRWVGGNRGGVRRRDRTIRIADLLGAVEPPSYSRI